MKSNQAGPRVWINSIIILLSALISHYLACGTFVSLLPFTFFLLITFFSLSVLNNRISNARAIYLLSMGNQVVSHYLLGSNSMNVNMSGMNMSGMNMSGMNMSGMNMDIGSAGWKMFAYHSIGAILTYFFISHNEKFWDLANFTLQNFKVEFLSAPIAIKKFQYFKGIVMAFLLIMSKLNSWVININARKHAPPLMI